MIYLDTSAALAMLLAENRKPPARIWAEPLVASRLLEYEIWTRIHARGLAESHSGPAHAILERVTLIELSPSVLQRALEPFPVAVRTLDALHLATASYLASVRQKLLVATFDTRMRQAAQALGLGLAF